MMPALSALRIRHIAALLAKQETRAYLHAGILILIALLVLFGELHGQFFQLAPLSPDKLLHFQLGRGIAAGAFFLVYICIIVRILLIDRADSSITRVLLWTPLLILLAFVGAAFLTLALAVFKETLDLGGVGRVESQDIFFTLRGALTMTPAIAVIIVLTPALIPLDMLMQIPHLMLREIHTGIETFDEYLRAAGRQQQKIAQATVLLVEDDILCAATMMDFCTSIGLHCHHVSTIFDAEQYLQHHVTQIKLIIADNFVRVDPFGRNTTGAEWIQSLNQKYPRGSRPFLIIMISGHTDQLPDIKNQADYVMNKPWSPRKLGAILEQNGLSQCSLGKAE